MEQQADAGARQQPLSETMSRLTLLDTAAQTALPPSSPVQRLKSPPLQSSPVARNASTPSRPSNTPLRRSASSLSINGRSSSPAVARRTSTTNLRNGADSPVSHSPKLTNRRSSSNLLISQLMPAFEEPAPVTAERIAIDHFTKELASHSDPSKPTECKTVVIIHDDCYGHRFSRLKTKDTIHSIVERPERIQAGVMGISAAYVRLGERHSGGVYAPHPKKESPKEMPFRIIRSTRKVPLHSDAVTAVHGKEWMKELQGLCDGSEQKLAAGAVEIARTPNANGTPKEQLHAGDLYLSQESINAFEGALGGVCDAVDMVFQGSMNGQGPNQAFACVRPPGHHCSSDWPSGFCWLNNVHVGIQHAVQKYGLTHAAIIDFDLHHGDGSQEIAWGHNERMQFPKSKNFPNSKKNFIGYFSLHDINSFPCEFGDREKCQMASLCIDNAHGQAIWNVHLEKWARPEEFWNLYETRYKVLIEKTRKFLKHRTNELRAGKNHPKPRSAIFISAGFDASEHEGGGMQRHSVNVLTEFYARFTRDIVELANEEGTSVDGRVISVLEGGYSDKALVSGVLSHISGLCEGHILAHHQQEVIKQETDALHIGLSGLPSNNSVYNVPAQIPMKYNTEWWHNMHLDTLVQLLHPAAPIDKSGPKKSRVATYSSPTHASTMKVVDPIKVGHRNSSFGSRAPSAITSRAASPPPPDVDWATASSELCKLLIPTNRQVNSNTQEDLNPREVKIKKEKTPEMAAPVGANGRPLRDRKARNSINPEMDTIVAQRKASVDRRQTVGHPLPTTELIERPKERRRLSIASTISTTSVANPVTARARPAKAAAVEVKKTRPSSSNTSSRASSVKPATIQRVPSISSRPKVGTRTSSSSVAPVQEQSPSNADTEMDSLTTGLKRITIKVPSNEEYAARLPKPLTAGKSVPGTSKAAVKKPVTARPTKPATTTAAKRTTVREPVKPRATPPIAPKQPVIKQESVATPPLAQIPVAPATPSEVQTSDPQSALPANVLPPQESYPVAIDPQLMAYPNPAPSSVSLSSPISSSSSQTGQSSYQTIQFAQPNSDLSAEQAAKQIQSNGYSNGFQWMPPNSDTNAPLPPRPSDVAKTQKTTPVFTSTGSIPFASQEEKG